VRFDGLKIHIFALRLKNSKPQQQQQQLHEQQELWSLATPSFATLMKINLFQPKWPPCRAAKLEMQLRNWKIALSLSTMSFFALGQMTLVGMSSMRMLLFRDTGRSSM
jgi:hypothetical protein